MHADFELSSPSPRRQGIRRVLVASLGAALLLTSLMVSPAAAHHGKPKLGDPTVISSWILLSQQTLLGDATKKPQEAFLYLGFVEAAVYDAVVGIDGRYRPYSLHAHAPKGASDQAAAIAAAHKVIATYSPYNKVALDAAEMAALGQIPDSKAKTDGIAFGILAADNLIASRVNDGRNANVLFTKAPAPGVWRPTPPANLAMAVPWMGAVTPLLIQSGAQFGEPGPPPAMTSWEYTRDYVEVKALGSAGSTQRTVAETNVANFFSGNATVQYTAALVDQMTRRHLDIVDAAHMFAAVGMTMADTIIAVWHAKLFYGFWRPITAINLGDTDGNPETTADTAWVPLLTTPPYPDYVSGYSGATGAFTRALARALGTRNLRLTLISTAVPNVTRFYRYGKSLDGDVISARVWLGIHFRFADIAGVDMGHNVADWALGHYFQRTDGDDDD
jgi:hypothetical protein